jgi:hypothetical protein
MKPFFSLLTVLLIGSALCLSAPPDFVANRGGSAPAVKYVYRHGPLVAGFEDHSMSIGAGIGRVRVEFAGGNASSAVSVAGESLVYRNAWNGIDAVYAAHGKTVKSEYHVAPGADPNLIRLRYRGETVPRIRPDGSLVIGVPGAELIDSPPFAYQDIGMRVPVAAAYRVFADGTVGFALGAYDPSRPLVIDPVMNYSTLFGGMGDTTVTAVALDTYGNAIVAGWTSSTDLPANGAKTKSGGGVDAFVAKIAGQGNQIVWCTYLGGIGDDRAFGIALDRSNNVYVTGWTQSFNFPLLGAIQTKLLGSRNAFVTKLNASGTNIVYSTFLGGSSHDQGNAIAVDFAGNAYVTGDVSSYNFPVLRGFQMSNGGQQDAFVTKLSPAGNAIVFSTYLGGGGADHGAAITVDPWNQVYVAGSTYSSNFPVAAPTQARIGGGQDAFMTELNASGTGLVFSTYIGGSGGTPGLGEGSTAVALDGAYNIYVAGVTSSIDFPTTAGAYQRTVSNGGAGDHGFVWKANTAKQVVYSTYLGGLNVDMVNGMAVDTVGNAYVVGATSSTDFPGVRAFQPAITGQTNGFVAKLNKTGSTLIFSGFLGGSAADSANCVAVDARQNVVVAGIAQSADFPLVNPAQSYGRGPNSGFITRIVPGWYPILYKAGVWYRDVWRNLGYDGNSWMFSTSTFGQAGDLPIVGDWNKTGTTKLGVFRKGLWILDTNDNGVIDAGDRQFYFGQTGDIPVVGDWDGTGTVKAGLFRQGMFILDVSGHLTGIPTGKIDWWFYYGLPTDIPVTGDWGSTGVTKVGVFRDGAWYLDVNNAHVWNPAGLTYTYGGTGDSPVVGDWDGSGTPRIGVNHAGVWRINTNADGVYRSTDAQFTLADSTFQVLVGR